MKTGSGKYEQLLALCSGLAPATTAVAHPCEASALAGAMDAARLRLIQPILVGPAAEVAAVRAGGGLAARAVDPADPGGAGGEDRVGRDGGRPRARRSADRGRAAQPRRSRQGGGA